MARRTISAEGLFCLLKGKGSPKKSKVLLLHGAADPLLRAAQVKLKHSLKRVATSRRFKPKHPHTTATPTKRELYSQPEPKACIKRFLEFMGWESRFFVYTPTPKIIARLPSKFVYELQLHAQPFASFTDVQEAYHSLKALEVNGYGINRYGPQVLLIQRDLTTQEECPM